MAAEKWRNAFIGVRNQSKPVKVKFEMAAAGTSNGYSILYRPLTQISYTLPARRSGGRAGRGSVEWDFSSGESVLSEEAGSEQRARRQSEKVSTLFSPQLC